jgi:FixJ family two-component response regulator
MFKLIQLKADFRRTAINGTSVARISSVKSALIQIVDDDEAIRDSLKLLLEMRGYRVETFGSGAEFFQNGALAGADCVILDVNLPGESGFEVLAKMRKNGVATPAIFISGRGTATTQARAVRAQAVAYFDKPVAPAELFSAIARAVPSRHK